MTVRDRVTLDVRTAHTQLEQAQLNLQLLREEILPALQQTQELARRTYENGGAPYFLVLQTTTQYLDSRMRELQLEADMRRAVAELERGVGTKLASLSTNDTGSTLNLLPVPAPAASEVSTTDSHVRKTGWKRSHVQPATHSSVINVVEKATDGEAIHIPLHLSVTPDGKTASQVSHKTPIPQQAARSNYKQRNRKQKRAGRSRSKNRKQDAEHVQVTVDIRLDPRLVHSGVRTAESGSGSEDGTSED